jgi:tripartite-type tricarboxylate transporter receptor subunit TctC
LEVVPPQGKTLVALVSTMAGIGRLTAAPPGVPKGRLEVLIEAYGKALNDPEFLAKAATMKIPIDPALGQEVADMVKASLAHSPEDMELLKKIIKP